MTKPTHRKRVSLRCLSHCLVFLGTTALSAASAQQIDGPATGLAENNPGVVVRHVRRVFHNGQHNAFTDLVRFGDKFFLTFRSCPDGHMVFPTSKILILQSDDTVHWKQVAQFNVPQRDTRDPHFLVFQDKLFVYTGTWYSGDGELPRDQYDLNLHLGYGVVSTDGRLWSEPFLLEGTFGHYIWRAAAFGGKAYLCGRRKHDFAVGPKGEGQTVESAMLESDDGVIWRTRGLFQTERGDETAFVFEPDGKVTGVARRGSGNAQLVTSRPPYHQWTRRDLERYIGGPLLTRWGDRWVVGGRKNVAGLGPKTALSWMQSGKLHEFARLPSGGDNSYPGFVAISDNHAVVSWYSSHEKDAQGKPMTAIYMADLMIE
ncbi:MAG: hypothetical protein HKN47_06315 [Pirellulaceae bacterium]|nr:hypothetical protein [Pirellulaceae bacterium]